jgi:hypothetical protein
MGRLLMTMSTISVLFYGMMFLTFFTATAVQDDWLAMCSLHCENGTFLGKATVWSVITLDGVCAHFFPLSQMSSDDRKKYDVAKWSKIFCSPVCRLIFSFFPCHFDLL